MSGIIFYLLEQKAGVLYGEGVSSSKHVIAIMVIIS